MVRRVSAAALALTAALALPARAAGWDAPSFLARMTAVTDSELFPGSSVSDSDESLQLGLEAETGLRLSRNLKLGLQLDASGSKYQRFAEADFGRLGVVSSLRSGSTTGTLGGEWTPKRLKFPGSLDEGGVFSRQELQLGVKQALGPVVRVRLEVRFRSDDYRAPFDARDSDSRELYGQFGVRARAGWTLRAEGATSHSEASSRKYTQDEHWASLGAAWANASWKIDAAVVSGVGRYPDALIGDSNHHRRDQSFESRIRVTRVIASGWSVLLGGQQYEQISTRSDRTYTTHEFRVGLEWARTGR